MVEKRLEVQGSMALGFVDLDKAFDTVPREMVMATLRWMGVPEAEVRMVEGTYEKTTARVVVGEGASEEFEVNNGLRQGSVLSPLLFIAVLDLISRKTVVKNAMKKLLYADDLALVTNGKQELQETMGEWNGLFIKHGLKLNLEKTEVLHIGHQREELDIDLERKKLTQRDSFVYLGGAVYGDGKTEREVRRRVQAGANAWRAVEGVMADRRISKRLKGKVMSVFRALHGLAPACVTTLITSYEPRRALRSAGTALLCVPRHNLERYGRRSFSCAGPALWNSLPETMRLADSLYTFKSQLKTHYFKLAYNL